MMMVSNQKGQGCQNDLSARQVLHLLNPTDYTVYYMYMHCF